MDIIVISVSWGEARCPAPAGPRPGTLPDSLAGRTVAPHCATAVKLANGPAGSFHRRFGCFRCGPVRGTVPLNSYRYRPCVSTLQVRVLTRYLRVIFASRCGNLRGRERLQSAWRRPRACNKKRQTGEPPANRAASPKACGERGTGSANCPQASHGVELSGPHPIYTWRSRFFKASFRRRTYHMDRSLSLPFSDRALPSAIRPGGVSHSRPARGAQDSRPRPADSRGAVFPSAPVRRPVFPSRGGETHRGVSLPASQRTAAASHRGGPAFRRGSGRTQIRSLRDRARRSTHPRPIRPNLPHDKIHTPTAPLRPPPRKPTLPYPTKPQARTHRHATGPGAPPPNRVCRHSL